MKKPSIDFIVVTAVIGLLLVVLILWGSNNAPSNGSSSGSIELSEKRGLLVAVYKVPEQSDLGRYRVKEVWVEKDESSEDNHLVVRLIGPHHGTEPRVQVAGLDAIDYRHIWSQLGGPPYEVWTAPAPLPNTLTLTRDGKKLLLELKDN